MLGASDYIAAGAFRSENSRNAVALRNVYDQDRKSEMRRNVWRFAIRTVALRATGTFTKFLTFANWAIGTTYAQNDVVTATDGEVYYSQIAANIGNDPTLNPTQWTRYFGNLAALEYVTTWSNSITYALNNHTVGSDGQVYISIVNGANLNHNPVGDGGVHWAVSTDGTLATTDLYYSGEILYIGNNSYMLTVSQTTAAAPPAGANWFAFTAMPTLTSPDFIYPIGSGPSAQQSTKNTYRLPNGFLREAPQDPKAGSVLYLGAPSALPYSDRNLEGNFFTTKDSGVQLYRFVFDVADPNLWDPMFEIGFAARLALDTCQAITQSSAKMADLTKEYDRVMTDARLVNGIETGATQPPEDDYIACRV